MRRVILAAAGLVLMATSAAEARSRCEEYAHNRRVTGTVVGAVGGGLLGSAIAGHGSKGTGALVGAGLGAVVGNNVARVSCDRHVYHHHAAVPPPARYAGAYPPTCHYVTQPYYDPAGRLTYAPTQVCE